MRKIFVLGELLMISSLVPLFVLPFSINCYIWFAVFMSGLLIATEFWKHSVSKNKVTTCGQTGEKVEGT